jgi:hypothetical protein
MRPDTRNICVDGKVVLLRNIEFYVVNLDFVIGNVVCVSFPEPFGIFPKHEFPSFLQLC